MSSKDKIFGTNNGDISKELRKSHFHMGSHHEKNPTSEYQIKYKEYPIDNLSKIGKESLNLRATNLVVGTDGIAGASSLYKSSFVPHGKVEQAALNKEVMNDLRKHHFKFGYGENQGHPTEFNSNYDDKTGALDLAQTRKDINTFKNTMRSHAEKWADSEKYYDTTNKKTYDDKSRTAGQNLQEMKEGIQKHLEEMRSTNIVFGFDPYRAKTSLMRSDFPERKSDYHRARPELDLKETHFYLGDEPVNYTSTIKEQYNAKTIPADQREFAKAVEKDLRATHYQLGFDTADNMKPLSKDSYIEHGKEHFADRGKNPLLWNNHFDFKNNNYGVPAADKMNAYTSTYKSDMTDFNDRAVRTQARNDRMDRNSQIYLGSHNETGNTEYLSRFIDQGHAKVALEAELKKDLQSSHFALGIDPKDYKTMYKMHHGDKGGAATGNEAALETMKDLRRTHFTLGYNNRDHKTSYRIEYTQKPIPSNEFNKTLKADLLATHLEFS